MNSLSLLCLLQLLQLTHVYTCIQKSGIPNQTWPFRKTPTFIAAEITGTWYASLQTTYEKHQCMAQLSEQEYHVNKHTAFVTNLREHQRPQMWWPLNNAVIHFCSTVRLLLPATWYVQLYMYVHSGHMLMHATLQPEGIFCTRRFRHCNLTSKLTATIL